MDDKRTYIDDLNWTILHYRAKASEAKVLGPVYSFMADMMENSKAASSVKSGLMNKKMEMRERRKRLGWLGYMKSIWVDPWLKQLK